MVPEEVGDEVGVARFVMLTILIEEIHGSRSAVSSGHDRIDVMGDAGSIERAGDRYGDEVNSPNPVLMVGVSGDVPLRGTQKLRRLGWGDGFSGATRPFAAPGLDFDEDEFLAIEHDQIQFP